MNGRWLDRGNERGCCVARCFDNNIYITADYKKTELRKSVELMEKTLLEPMALALKRRLRAERDSTLCYIFDRVFVC